MKARNSTEEFIHRFSKSRVLYERALSIFPRGATHDARVVYPFPIYITHANGSHKWDVDNYEYIDYVCGHGSLILGHAHPSLIASVNDQIARGTHYGAGNPLEVEWAELIKSLVPSAEQVEFTNSETEANMLAVRLARAFTGRNKIVKFRGQSGGWYDHFMVGTKEPWNAPTSAGILAADIENTIAIPLNDEEALIKVLSKRDVAVLMVEPTCGILGAGIALPFYKVIREVTKQYGTLLLFDEVVSGFRFSPGGAQLLRGITPDLTALGKIVAGGLPGAGAAGGQRDIMGLMAQSNDPDWNRLKRVIHIGTFNANPLCAAAGIATLKILSTGEPQKIADQRANILREGIEQVLEDRDIAGCIYGESSYCHLYFGECETRDKCEMTICLNSRKVRPANVWAALHINLVLAGVHTLNWADLFTSTAHTEDDINKTIEAFDKAFNQMIKEGVLKDYLKNPR